MPFNTIKDRIINLDFSDEYYSDSRSWIQTIIEQIKTDKIYDEYCKNKKDITVLDLGANVGLVSLYLSDIASRILAVEAGPKQLELLKQNCKNETNIEIVEAAIAGNNEDVIFYMKPDNNTTNSLIKSNSNTEYSINVKGITIPKLLEDYNVEKVDFCKIDIEGSEMVSLTEDIIKQFYDKIDFIFLEVHATNPINWRQDLRQNLVKLYNLLNKCGYKCKSPYMDMVMSGNMYPISDFVVDKIYCYK
jgi:FkbM family methyltransferase